MHVVGIVSSCSSSSYFAATATTHLSPTMSLPGQHSITADSAKNLPSRRLRCRRGCSSSPCQVSRGMLPYVFLLGTQLTTTPQCPSKRHDVYFAHFTNKQFHLHTTKKIIPAATSTVLGFGLKFIPVPKKSICQDDVDEAIKQFDRDFYIKVFFADDNYTSEDNEPIKKLRINSKWMPDQPPFKITQ
jgi:hypothetical protein